MAQRRTVNEWMNIIQQCKSSGYSDSEWCRQNGIPISTFYRKLSDLRKKAVLDEPVKPILHEKQEVVQVNLRDESPNIIQQPSKNEVGLRLNINGITIDILNGAAKATIENTLQSLRSLC